MEGDGITIKFDSRGWNRDLAIFAETSKKGMEEILEDQARLAVEEIIKMTPPGNESSSGLTAKKAGEGAVKRDLNRLFWPVKKAEARPVSIPAVHRQNRTKRGRVNKRQWKYKVYKADFNRYLSAEKKKVGQLAGGWNRAADLLNAKRPAWIKRHGASRGDAKIKRRERSITVWIRNRVTYASGQELDAIVYRALRNRENKLARRVKHYLESLNR